MSYRWPCLLLSLAAALLAPPASAAFHFKPEVKARATVQFLGSAPGKYALVADNGIIFEPTNLQRNYQIDGARVRFTAKALLRPAPLITGARVVRITSIHSLPSGEFRLPPAARREIPRLP